MFRNRNSFSLLNISGSLFLYWCLLWSSPSFAQNGLWTWMKGSNLVNSNGNYGIQGVASPTNEPPGLYEAAEWTDANGNFWIFGGTPNVLFAVASALWKYDPNTNEWTWIKGPSTVDAYGVYGVQGIPSPVNHPGARAYGASSWTDLNGNLWLYGGFGYAASGSFGGLNDLWKYDPATNEWTWMKGSNAINQSPSYGTLRVSAASNQPPRRYEANASWVDNSGDLWFYSGLCPNTFADDMWRYSISMNEWTWMSGQSSGIISANHGTKQAAAATNTPGSRMAFNHWKDTLGNFWFFGGVLLDTNQSVLMADMWMYNPTTYQWTWMAGDSTPDVTTTFTQQCVPGNGLPGAAHENRACWTDPCGRFWLFGGLDTTDSYYNTIWMFDPTTLQFTWVTGSVSSNSPPNFGAIGIPSPSSIPPSSFGNNAFQGSNGELWLFGGQNILFNYFNTLWRYQIDPDCPGSTISSQFYIQPTTPECAPYTVQFSPTFTTYDTYHWDFGESNNQADTSNLPSPSWTYTQGGTYTVRLIISHTFSCNSFKQDTAMLTLTTYSLPIVDLGSDTIICDQQSITLNAGNFTSYLWNTGDTTPTLVVDSGGYYLAQVIDSNGCRNSDSIKISVAHLPNANLGADTTICAGQVVQLNATATGTYLWNTGDTSASITVTASGTYSLQIDSAGCLNSDTTTIMVNPLPIVDLGPDTIVCPNTTLVLDATNAGATYLWNTGTTSSSITTDSAGIYRVIVDLSGCQMLDSILISYSDSVRLGSDLSLCPLITGVLLDAGNPGASYLWNTGATTQTILVENASLYWVTMTNGNCVLTDSILVTGELGGSQLYIPNAFTPNNDGQNDLFLPIGQGIADFNMLIFDRWGEKIYETDDFTIGWNGLFKTEMVQQGIYVYVIYYSSTCSGQKKLKKIGHVAVMR
jgi:gliding motility-associated-like protein